MNIDRRSLLTMLGAAAIAPALPAIGKPSVMDALKDIIESKTPFDFNIWSYVSLRGEHMISYCFRTKMDRFQIAKVIDKNDPAEWKTWTEKIAPDCPYASGPISYDDRFDPFMASGRPEQRG